MATGNFYGNRSMGMGYSPNRSRDVDRYNPSTRGNYAFVNANGSRQTGYYYSASQTYSTSTYGTKQGRYLGNGQYVVD